MKKYDTVIFDLDGTLLNTLEDLTDSVNYVLKKYSCPQKTIKEVCSYVGNGIRLLIERAVPNGAENPLFEDMLKDFLAYYEIHCNDKTAPYEGVVELLRTLKKKGYKLAIVSNKFDSAVKDLAKLYFSDTISVAIGESEGVRKKPAPDTVIKALGELGSDKNTSIFIGDSEVDFETSKNSGLDCISVLWGFRTKEFLSSLGATVFAETPDEVLSIIEG
ncbi:MAG: HAD-IA family hydrolase [Clostridia bacterium]|nr:HAD-IA family hydrolase [Clostridia bacterium]